MAKSTTKVGRVVAQKRKNRSWAKGFKSIGLILFVAISALVVFGGIYFSQRLAVAAGQVPELANLMQGGRMDATRIYSVDNKLLYESVKEFREPVVLSEVPKHVRDAILAAEDKRFYTHSGVDAWALARVVVTNAREQRIAGGGSTLTMQLAKLTFSDSEQTIERKVNDMALALQIERQLTKDQILELYLNQVYFGSGAYGIAAASEVYFNKKLKDITIAEAAMLARCVRLPSTQNPFVNYEVAVTNKKVVLDIMREEGMITAAQHQQAVSARPKLANRINRDKTIRRAPYFVRHVLDELRKMPQMQGVDFENGGFRIETTVDTRLQDRSDKEARELVQRFRRQGTRTAAFVLMDSSGALLALTGGVDFASRQFNAATQGRRQPGSSFKPFVYTAGFYYNEFSGPNDSISNATFVGRSMGRPWRVAGNGATSSVLNAVAFSYNAAAVRAIDKVRPTTAVRFANDVFGFNLQPRDAVLSLALGSVAVSPLQMAEAYTVFQNFGQRRVQPYAINRILDSNGRVVYSRSEGENVIALRQMPSGPFEDINLCMRAVVTKGTASNFASGIPNARGKTGTTNDNRDAWFCGYTNRFIGIGWVSGEYKDDDGRIRYQSMSDSVMGGTVTVRMWRDVIREAQRYYKETRISGLGLAETGFENSYVDDLEPQQERGQRDEVGNPEEDTAPRQDEAPREDEPVAQPETAPEPEPEPVPEVTPPPVEPPPALPDGSGLPDGAGEPPPDDGSLNT